MGQYFGDTQGGVSRTLTMEKAMQILHDDGLLHSYLNFADCGDMSDDDVKLINLWDIYNLYAMLSSCIVYCRDKKQAKRIGAKLCTIDYVTTSVIYGGMDLDERDLVMREWNNGKTRVLVTNESIGPYGLNTHKNHLVINFDMHIDPQHYWVRHGRRWHHNQCIVINMIMDKEFELIRKIEKVNDIHMYEMDAVILGGFW